MSKGFLSLMENDVWLLSELPKGHSAVGGKWHFCMKFGADGEVLRYKARYVAKGFTQKMGRDYHETFSPTVRLSTIRCVIAYAAQLGCDVQQMDIKTAFLNAPIEENIYVRQPEGFEKYDDKGNVLFCKLKKSLYGLKQAGRNWYLTMSGYLLDLGFIASKNDHCLFIRHVGVLSSFICLWVDDLIYFSTESDFDTTFKSEIKKRFIISDHLRLCWFLGMKVEFGTAGEISLSQEQYICDLLLKFEMESCKPIGSPGPEKVGLTREDCPAENTPEAREMRGNDYRGLIGSLNYLVTTTRPDVAFISHMLSSFLENPGLQHWITAKHVLRYLQGTKHYKLIFRKDLEGIRLRGYSDADYGGNLDSRRSTSGYCFSLQQDSACVSWSSKLQSTVALSTAEAELVAATVGAQEMVHLTAILHDMGLTQTLPMILFVDNQACIAMSKNPVHHGKTKHFAIKLCYLRDLCTNKFLVLEYVSTDTMPADILTKCLGKLKTNLFCEFIMGKLGIR